MKKKVLFFMGAILLLTGCSKNSDFQAGADDHSEAAIKAHAKSVFGVDFNSEQAWTTASQQQVTVQYTSAVSEIQILVYAYEPEDSTSTLRVLTSYQPSGDGEVTLNVDVPDVNLGLFASFITARGLYMSKIVDGKAAYNENAATRSSSGATRTLSFDYNLPSEENLRLTETIVPYEATRFGFDQELFYGMEDYDSQKMSIPDYSEDMKVTFRTLVFSYFPDGRQFNNLSKVKQTGLYNEHIYPFTTGDEPIIVAPVYKCDGAGRYGNEVYNSDLYYYYFKDEDLIGKDAISYIRNLPKYKALPFSNHFGVNEDDVIARRNAYALIYWGEGVPDENTHGTYTFPEGYKIGFIVRATSTTEGGKKQGELWADGRFNNEINSYQPCNFRSSKLETDGPRAAWLSLNGRLLLCWESGTDTDFNDLILDFEGGIEGIVVIPDVEGQVYTFCFEDTDKGDYDLNDVVIRAVRKSSTEVEYSVEACGAYDELYIRNINAGKITDDAEVHSLFGKTTGMFINTERNAEKYPAVVGTKTVNSSFSLLDINTQPYIYDANTKKVIRLSKKGEDPHGIMLSYAFRWPLEKVCVKDAYLEFNSWGQDPVMSTDWYKRPVEERVY